MRAGTAGPDVVGIDGAYFRKSMYYLSWMVGIFVLTLIIGQFPTLILFIGLYLKFWGNFGWKVILGYMVGATIFLLVMFNRNRPSALV